MADVHYTTDPLPLPLPGEETPPTFMNLMFATSHAVERFDERYGGTLTHEDAQQAVEDVLDGRGIMLSRQSGGAERWYVLVHGRPAHIVVYPAARIIITFLPILRRRSKLTKRNTVMPADPDDTYW